MRTAVALVGLVLLTGCSSGTPNDAAGGPSPTPTSQSSSPTPSQSTATPPTTPTPSESSPGTEIVVGDSDYGQMLFDARGQAIYLFDVETPNTAGCYDECAVAWPPVLTKGLPVAGDGVRAGLLSTIKRRDGSRQVTYDGHPLYFYAHEGPGQVLCHDVFLNGGNWYVVQPDGDAAPPG